MKPSIGRVSKVVRQPHTAGTQPVTLQAALYASGDAAGRRARRRPAPRLPRRPSDRRQRPVVGHVAGSVGVGRATRPSRAPAAARRSPRSATASGSPPWVCLRRERSCGVAALSGGVVAGLTWAGKATEPFLVGRLGVGVVVVPVPPLVGRGLGVALRGQTSQDTPSRRPGRR